MNNDVYVKSLVMQVKQIMAERKNLEEERTVLSKRNAEIQQRIFKLMDLEDEARRNVSNELYKE